MPHRPQNPPGGPARDQAAQISYDAAPRPNVGQPQALSRRARARAKAAAKTAAKTKPHPPVNPGVMLAAQSAAPSAGQSAAPPPSRSQLPAFGPSTHQLSGHYYETANSGSMPRGASLQPDLVNPVEAPQHQIVHTITPPQQNIHMMKRENPPPGPSLDARLSTMETDIAWIRRHLVQRNEMEKTRLDETLRTARQIHQQMQTIGGSRDEQPAGVQADARPDVEMNHFDPRLLSNAEGDPQMSDPTTMAAEMSTGQFGATDGQFPGHQIQEFR